MFGGMSGGDEFGRAVARKAVAQILEVAGFHGAHRSAVDALVEVLLRYVSQLGKAASFHANIAGRALANEYDVIQSLEELEGVSQGLAGASTSSRCLVSSGVVKDIITFVGAANEVPFALPLPKFPVLRVLLQPAPSFAVMGRENGMRHVPEWLPAFPELHTYVRTEVWSEKPARMGLDKEERSRQRRKSEKSLLSLQYRLALAGANGFAPMVAEDGAEKGKELQVVGSNSNPFLEPALPYGEKAMSEVAVLNTGKKHSILEAFAPAIESANGGEVYGVTCQDQNQSQKSIVPKERAPVYLRVGIGRKSLAAALNLRILDEKNNPWFLNEEVKDEWKRRAGMILKEAMESPQNLTQL